MLALVVMWLGVTVPLVLAGAYFGFRKGGYELPIKVNIIPRPVQYACHLHDARSDVFQVPPHKWHTSVLVRMLVGGLAPFGAVFIELFFIFNVEYINLSNDGTLQLLSGNLAEPVLLPLRHPVHCAGGVWHRMCGDQHRVDVSAAQRRGAILVVFDLWCDDVV